jgi:hypothetical protein
VFTSEKYVEIWVMYIFAYTFHCNILSPTVHAFVHVNSDFNISFQSVYLLTQYIDHWGRKSYVGTIFLRATNYHPAIW